MSRFLMAASFSIAMLGSGLAMAQSSMTAPSNGADNGTNPALSSKMGAAQPGMAATSSDSGNMGTGASSAAIGTGNTDKTGVVTPQAPGVTATQGVTGANPNNPGGLPKTNTP